MQRLLNFFIVISAGLSLAAFTAWAQPANDNFTNAQVLIGPAGSVTGASTNATHETGEPFNCGIPGGFSIWYSWTNATSGQATFNTEGSDFDTTLGVYTGTNVASLTTVGCNADVSFS